VNAEFRFGPRNMTSNFLSPLKWNQRSHRSKFLYITQLSYKRMYHNYRASAINVYHTVRTCGSHDIARWYLFIRVAILIFQMEFSYPHVWTLFPYVIARWYLFFFVFVCYCAVVSVFFCFRISCVRSFYNICMIICSVVASCCCLIVPVFFFFDTTFVVCAVSRTGVS